MQVVPAENSTTSGQETVEVTLHKVQVALEMTVDDPQTIIENVTLVNAMRRGMANLLNVSEESVTVIFDTSRRLTAGNSTTLNVLFEVTFNDAAAAEVKRADVASSTASEATQELGAVLADVGYQGSVEVVGKSVAVQVETVQVPVTTMTSSSSSTESSTASTTESGSTTTTTTATESNESTTSTTSTTTKFPPEDPIITDDATSVRLFLSTALAVLAAVAF